MTVPPESPAQLSPVAERQAVRQAMKSSRRGSGPLRKQLVYLAFCLPGLGLLAAFNYAPMAGIVLAFKDFRASQGIFGSRWVGLENFVFLFSGDTAWRITRNTVMMNALFIVTSLVVAIALAIILHEIRERHPAAARIYQSSMFFPFVLSWVVVANFAFAFLDPSRGVLNTFLEMVTLPVVDWYSTPEAWPVILTVVDTWKGVGFWVIIYLARILAINPSLYEAASLDGASKLRQIRHITLPMLVPIITLNVLLAVSKIFNADFGLFYQVTRNNPTLYEFTDVIDTYVFRSLTSTGDIGMAAAAGLYQAVVGFVLVLSANAYVRRRRAEDALF